MTMVDVLGNNEGEGRGSKRNSAPIKRTPFGFGPQRALLGLSLVLIALNLRPVFSSASALLPEIRTEFDLSSFGTSALTTLPVICLGIFSPLAPKFAQRFGTEWVLFCALLLLAIGTGIRGCSSATLLFFGTVLAGASIAFGNVLLPGIVKRDFPEKTALVTGCYTMALNAGAAGGAGLTLPVFEAMGGSINGALALWGIPAILVGLLWSIQLVGKKPGTRATTPQRLGLWSNRLAWNVTLFMGLQSSLAFCVFGWLVPILRDRGVDAVNAGAMVSLSVMFQAAACLMAPHFAVRGKDQRAVILIFCVIAVAALLGLLFAPISGVWYWAALQGIGQGGLVSIALTLIVLRSSDAQVAAHLSGMAQFVGYSLAAGGPLVVGLIRGLTGSFTWAAVLFVLIGVGIGLNGWFAGQDGVVRPR